MLGGLRHGGCKWISGVAADNDLFLPRHSMQLAIHPHRRFSRKCATRSAHTNRQYLVTFRGTTKSARSDAMRNHLPKLHNGRGIVLVCACRWFLGEERMGREGEEKEFNRYTYTELTLETKFGLIIMAAGAIPVIVVDHYVLPYQDLLDWETFSIRIPEHRLLEEFFKSLSTQVHTALESARINLFSGDNAWQPYQDLLDWETFSIRIPEHRLLEEFFKSLSTQVHTALESARINLFSGDNAWQRALEPAAVTPSPSTKHHCSGGMNRRALPCNDRPATPHVCMMRTAPVQPTNPSPTAAAAGSWLFAAGNRWRQHKLHFRLEAATAAEAMHTYRQDEGNVEDSCHACQLHSHHTWMLMEAGSHAGCSCCNFPDSAAAVVLMQRSHMCEQGGRLPEDRWRMMMGGAHMMDREEQLWTHTSMVMVGTSNHSDAIMRRCVSSVITAIDRTAAITLRPTPAPIWREADLAHVTRSDEEEAHEAVEPTTMMTMTSDEATAVPDVAALWMNGPSASGPSPPPRPRRRWSPTAAAAAMDVESVMCVDVPLPHMTTMMMVVSGLWWMWTAHAHA
ncbi:hypothetical protein PTSG_12156, partial [Salpingoeca rosetta]